MIGLFSAMVILATDGFSCACLCRYNPEKAVSSFNRSFFTDILLVRTSSSADGSAQATVVQAWKGGSKPGESIRLTRRVPPRSDCDFVTLLPTAEYVVFAERTNTGDLVVSQCDVLKGEQAAEVSKLLNRATESGR